MEDQKAPDRRTFLEPHKLERDEETGFAKINHKASESYVLLEASDIKNLDANGRPINAQQGKRVFYAQKANKYFRDPECTTEYTSSEITALGLPLPSAIEAARLKIMKDALEQGIELSRDELYTATSPSILLPQHFAK